jgi:LmbE family N-acetylglucosaminyl deacetylase
MESLGDIMGVWAHPDDETFASAGLMAAAVREGHRVVVVSATHGEAGVQDESRWPADKLMEIRDLELARALEIVGVTEHHYLDYPDGGCADVDVAEAIDRIVALMREVQPDTVLTMGPDGTTGHPDHIAVCEWVTEAFQREGKPGSRLLYMSFTPEWADEFLDSWSAVGAMMKDELLLTPRDELVVDVALPDDLLDLKVAALKAHESQTANVFALMGEEFMRRDLTQEMFRLGAGK